MNSRLPAGGRLDDAHHWFGLPNVRAASEEQTGGIRDDKRFDDETELRAAIAADVQAVWAYFISQN